MKLACWMLLLLATACAAWAQGPVTITIPGLGCTTPKGADTFPVLQWSSYSTGSGANQRFHLNAARASDDCSTKLFLAVARGNHFQTVTVTVYDSGGTHVVKVVSFSVANGESFTFGGSVSSSPSVSESVTLQAASMSST